MGRTDFSTPRRRVDLDVLKPRRVVMSPRGAASGGCCCLGWGPGLSGLCRTHDVSFERASRTLSAKIDTTSGWLRGMK